MLPSLLALATLLVLTPAIAHQGDGRFTDQGIRTAHNRYELDLGPVALEKIGRPCQLGSV